MVHAETTKFAVERLQMTVTTIPMPEKQAGATRPPVVLVSTLPREHASRSGYPLLAEYLQKDAWITAPRADPISLVPKCLARLARQFSFSRWYLGGSAAAEWNCARYLRSKPPRMVHLFWADFDLGFLDYYLARRGDWLCGTFHQCPDTLASIIRHPRRLRRFAAIILMSETQRAFMLDAGVPDERIHVVPHGVDTDYFTPASGAPAEPWTVLSVGSYRRNFDCLEAVCDSLNDLDGIRIRIIGPQALAGRFLNFKNVVYEWGVSDQELRAAYRSAACFLTLVENATANNALLEALACGLPIIAEHIGGIPEYVNEACAELVQPGNVAAVKKSILRLYNSNSLRSSMSHAARCRAEQLDWTQVAELTHLVYQSVAIRQGFGSHRS